MDEQTPRTAWAAAFPVATPFAFMQQAMHLSRWSRAGVDVGLSALVAMTRGACEFQCEVTTLLHRLSALNADYGLRLIESKDPGTHLNAQADHMRGLAEECMNAMQRLSESGLRVSQDVFMVGPSEATEAAEAAGTPSAAPKKPASRPTADPAREAA